MASNNEFLNRLNSFFLLVIAALLSFIAVIGERTFDKAEQAASKLTEIAAQVTQHEKSIQRHDEAIDKCGRRISVIERENNIAISEY